MLLLIRSLFIVFIGFCGVYYGLPSNLEIQSQYSPSTRVEDRHGRLIRDYRDENSLSYLKISHVSPLLIELIVKAEDKRFYQHQGIDFIATTRAFFQNLMSLKKISGASTITQQVARLGFSYKRNIANKALVMLHAFKLEQYYTKGEILEMYLNLIPFSYKVKGIVQGSSYYFGKDVKKLSPAEIATLAVLIRAPSRYVSIRNQDHLLKLRNKLLDQVGLSPKELKLSKIESWYFKKLRFQASSPHFVKALLKKHPIRKALLKTNLDLALQEEIQKILNEKMSQLKVFGVTAASVVVIDNRDGGILSYLGNHDFFAKGGEYDGIQLKRQPGSTMKAFTYALALESGKFNTASILPDIEMYFKAGLGSYKPRNYSMEYTGPRTLRDSLANSLNIPALYLADSLGVNRLYGFMKSFGFSFQSEASHYGVGITLGNAEVSLLELTTAYSAFANKGQYFSPRFLKEEIPRLNKTQMGQSTSLFITDILSDSYARRGSFGRRSHLDTRVPSAAKTGTSTLYRDNWVVGFTPRFTVGVWVGNMDQKEMKNVSGITGAGPIYHDVLNAASHYYPSGRFEVPKDLVKKQICSISGTLVTKYCKRSYTEIFKNGSEPISDCPYHKPLLVKSCHQKGDEVLVSLINLPPLYKSWLNKTTEDQVIKVCSNDYFEISLIENKEEDFKILSPPNGTIYAVDPDIPSRLQKIHVETLLPSLAKEVTWFLNDIEIKKTSPQEDFHWEVIKGLHKLKAELKYKNGTSKTDTISLRVL